MKQVFALVSLSLSLTAAAQQTAGTVTYTRTMQMQLNIKGNESITAMLPKSRTDKFELLFSNNQSLWKHAEEEAGADEVSGNGMQIRMVAAGQNDVVFCDFTQAKKTEQRELMEKKFIVTDSIRKLNWILSNETKQLLGHTCYKATAQRTGRRTQTTLENGQIARKEITDTSILTAWFTPAIPVPAGPEIQGQLPGLVLALDINGGRITYQATELSPKADAASIKEPTKGKKLTPDEYTQETARMMEELQKNNQGGGNRIIRMN